MEKAMLQHEVLHRASLFLEKNNRETRMAELLLQHYLGMSRSAFFANMREPVPDGVLKQFETALKKHAETGVPIQHLTGYEYFYGRKFQVNEHVLIPRPETEELVAHVINSAKQKFSSEQQITIVDIGTGSGIIACTLALELENAQVFATDISDKALVIAQANANQLNASVHFLQGDFLKPFINNGIKADVIVSNPPYISRDEEALLSDTVKGFDPELALFADDNGLAAYRKIIADLPYATTKNALVAFEIGYQQGEAVSSMLKSQYPHCDVQIIQDINGKDRIIAAQIE